jgi:hypothetical protein
MRKASYSFTDDERHLEIMVNLLLLKTLCTQIFQNAFNAEIVLYIAGIKTMQLGITSCLSSCTNFPLRGVFLGTPYIRGTINIMN